MNEAEIRAEIARLRSELKTLKAAEKVDQPTMPEKVMAQFWPWEKRFGRSVRAPEEAYALSRIIRHVCFRPEIVNRKAGSKGDEGFVTKCLASIETRNMTADEYDRYTDMLMLLLNILRDNRCDADIVFAKDAAEKWGKLMEAKKA